MLNETRKFGYALRYRVLSAAGGKPASALLAAVLIGLLMPTSKLSAQDEQLAVSDAWVRAMPPGRRMTAAYMRITNLGPTPVTIQGVSSELGDASIHETKVVDGQSRMVSVDALHLAPGEAANLSPGGLHVMLMGLSETPKEGDEVPLCLKLGEAQQCLSLPVLRTARSTK